MKTKTIPFNAEMAKDIQNGKIKGKIKTKGGRNVRIICWDKKSLFNTPIVALIYTGKKEELYFYSAQGVHLPDPCVAIDLVLEVPDNEPQFKPFDKVLVRNGEGFWQCALFSHMSDRDDFPYFANAFAFEQCIPYEGNEHLVGTTDKPKEE